MPNAQNRPVTVEARFHFDLSGFLLLRNSHHFYFPPQIRERLTPKQRELTAWMELARWEY